MPKLKIAINILFIMALFFVGIGQQDEVNAISTQVLQRGATGEDVIE